MTERHWCEFGYRVGHGHAKGVRQSEMTRDAIAWSSETDRLMFNGYIGSFRPVAIPEDYNVIRQDVRMLASNVGSVERAAFRAGYVFRLGPFGEQVFRRLNNAQVAAEDANEITPSEEIWSAPDGPLAFSDTFRLADAENQEMTKLGIGFRKSSDRIAAKRAFLRCAFAGTGLENQSMLGAALCNLGTVYGDEQRFIQAYGYAAFGGALLNLPEGHPAWQNVASLINGFRFQLDPDTVERILALIGRVSSAWDFAWHIDDMESASRRPSESSP